MSEEKESQEENRPEENSNEETAEATSAGSNERVEEIREAVLTSTKDILARITPFLKDPRGTWPSIKEEQETILQFYQNFLVCLIAIKPVCVFIGYGIVDRRVGATFFGSFSFMIVGFLVALLVPYIAAHIFQKIAPMCEGEISLENGLRLIGYSSVPTYLAGLLSLIPAFDFLAIIFACYSLYLFYLGVPVMANIPKQNLIKFIILSIAAFIVLYLVLFLPVALLTVGMSV